MSRKTFFVRPVARTFAVQNTGLLIDIEEFLHRVLPDGGYYVEREDDEVIRVWSDKYKRWVSLGIGSWLYTTSGNDWLFTASDMDFTKSFLAVEEVGAHTTDEHGQLVL